MPAVRAVLASFSSNKKYASAVISTPDIKQGETYTVTAGSETQSVEMSSLVYGESSQQGANGMGQGQPGMPQGENNGGMAPGSNPPSGGDSSGSGQPPEKPSGSASEIPNEAFGNKASENASSDAA